MFQRGPEYHPVLVDVAPRSSKSNLANLIQLQSRFGLMGRPGLATSTILREFDRVGYEDFVVPVPERSREQVQIIQSYRGGLLSADHEQGQLSRRVGEYQLGAARDGSLGTQYLRSAFGHDGNTTFASITDGTSNTVFVGEVIQGSTNDIRGAMWTTVPGARRS